MTALVADIRFAWRLLVKDRVFGLTAVAALALGIGLNNALLTVVDAFCVRGLPYAGARQLVDIAGRDASGRPAALPLTAFDRLGNGHAEFLTGVAAYATSAATLSGDSAAGERVTVAFVSPGAVRLMDIAPSRGRDFRVDDRAPDTRVAIIAAELWRTRYQSDSAILGSTIHLDDVPVTIIGVMPEGFRFPNNADVWRPLRDLPPPTAAQPSVSVVGRLAPGASLPEVRGAVAAAIRSPVTAARDDTLVVPLNDRFVADIRNPAWITFILVAFLLLVVACSNVATLLLARGVQRRREIAIRLSLGATRGRIVRQLLIESLMLAAAGGVAGLGLSIAATRLLQSAIPREGLAYWITFAPDWRILSALALVCLGTAFLAGLAPAVHLARHTQAAAARQTAHTASADRGAQIWTWLFLTTQLAITVVLMSRLSFTLEAYRLEHQRGPRLDAAQVLTFAVSLPRPAYSNPKTRRVFFEALTDRLRGDGRVESSALASGPPSSPGRPWSVSVLDRPVDAQSLRVSVTAVGDGYFDTIDLPIIQGRAFARVTEPADGAVAVVINERLATLLFPSGGAVGRRIRLASGPGAGAVERTIVGIVPAIRQQPTVEPAPAAFVPLGDDGGDVTVLLRTRGPADQLAPAVRSIVEQLDPHVPLRSVMTLARASWIAQWNARVSGAILTTLALSALLLATVGLTAMTAYAVGARRREIGIRLALGSSGAAVIGLVLRRALMQALVGVSVGAVIAFAWTGGSVSILQAAALVVTILIAASALPARRAARIDPLRTLREL